MTVRVRFAPSPTGYLHVGGARTALFNWLFAKRMGGQFLLRIEDTDRTRYSEEALTNLLAELKWMGLNWDEGPEIGGPHGPYQQSERLDLYQKAAWELVDAGKAYPCFCSSERLETMRASQEATGTPGGYDRHCRDLDPALAKARAEAGEPFVIRFKTPLSGETHFNDLLRGNITYANETLDDLVLLKTDGFPTYHLASVVDDHAMEITHVLRGEEWIPSTPKHVMLYAAFGWEAPIFVHLPVILSPDGGKLSKRKGAASVFDHKDMGILPHALFNFLALLGWNPGDYREILTLAELCELFDLNRLSLKSAVFDPKKLEWMNGQYLNTASGKELAPFLKEQITAQQALGLEGTWTDLQIESAAHLVRERCKSLLDLYPQSSFLFGLPSTWDEKDQKKALKEGWQERLTLIQNTLSAVSEEAWTVSELDSAFHALVEAHGGAFGQWGPVLRFALTRKMGGPGLPETMAWLGRAESLARLESTHQLAQ
jgi:glutamyl-tRNA synthetase